MYSVMLPIPLDIPFHRFGVWQSGRLSNTKSVRQCPSIASWEWKATIYSKFTHLPIHIACIVVLVTILLCTALDVDGQVDESADSTHGFKWWQIVTKFTKLVISLGWRMWTTRPSPGSQLGIKALAKKAWLLHISGALLRILDYVLCDARASTFDVL